MTPLTNEELHKLGLTHNYEINQIVELAYKAASALQQHIAHAVPKSPSR